MTTVPASQVPSSPLPNNPLPNNPPTNNPLPELRGVVMVTGTDTDVGKTIVTAVLAATLMRRGQRVGVCKPAQTGLGPAEPGDLAVVGNLTGLPDAHQHELVRLPEPLAPTTAARRAGVTVPSCDRLADQVAKLAARYDTLLVEGSGGVLVGLDGAGSTLVDLCVALRRRGVEPQVLCVCRAGLGSLNHTQLTVEALRAAALPIAGLVVGSWPTEPDLAAECNLVDLPLRTGVPLLALVPEGSGGDADAVARCADGLA